MQAKKETIIILLSALTQFCQAQDSLSFRNIEYTERQTPWLTSENAAGLVRYGQKNLAEAEVSTTYGRGGLVNFNQSSNDIQVDVGVESFFRISPRTVLFGSMSYTNFSGRSMAGSAFIPTSDYNRPFDLVEDSLTNTGTKHLDVYHLAGGIGSYIYKGVGSDVISGISVGARLDYTAANYAKYKDLRHQNKLMNLEATAGATIDLWQWATWGGNYRYRRNIESVTFSSIGTSDKTYKTLIDYGSFFGKVEQFGQQGFTDKSREMPLVDELHGVSFQLELRPLVWLSAYGCLSFGHREGYYGRKSPYTITYTNHNGDQTAYSLILSALLRKSRYSLDISYATEKLQNRAETYRELQNASGATYYEYYDPVETADKRWTQGHVSYIADLLFDGDLPTWTLQASYDWAKRVQLAYLYPYFRYQKLNNQAIALSATYNLKQKNDVWSFTIQGSHIKGTGEPYIDGTFTSVGGKQAGPATMPAYLMREYQYLTAKQYAVGCQVKYAFFFPTTQLRTHIRLKGDYRKATETFDYNDGDHHTNVTVAVGCTF